MSPEIVIVDRGRGPQLSTSRITVQDLVPYFRASFTDEQILDIMPTLSVEEIRAVERYVGDNREAVMEQDALIRERIAARRKSPEVEEAERRERVRRLECARQTFGNQNQERNGDRAAR